MLLSLTTNGSLPWSIAKTDEECLRMKSEFNYMKLAATNHCIELGTTELYSSNKYSMYEDNI